MEMDNSPKLAKKFGCELCNYRCSKESDFKKHIATLKHINGNKQEIAGTNKIADEVRCIRCNKQYKTTSGLWKHNKICVKMNTETDNIVISDTTHVPSTTDDVKILTALVIELVKSNTELQKQMIDVCKSNSNINTNINCNNNSNNKTFNLQFFLNEQCKDAMNITDFANSFDLQLSDLESVGELGYVEGITKIMVDKLNSMDIYKRPIHCSDAKREIIYVKDADVWAKEEKDNPKLRQAIKNVSFRNMKLVYNWSNAYPESKDNQTKLNDKYMQLVIQSTGGNGPILESENKIIRRIAKEIVIDKSQL
jgi:hypothetical protein